MSTSHATQSEADVIGAYQQRISELDNEVQQLLSREAKLSIGRGVAFALAALLGLMGFSGEAMTRTVCWTAAGVVFVVFVLIVRAHELLKSRRKTLQLRGELQRQRLARFQRQWDPVPFHSIDISPEFESVSRDLDLFCQGGLWHWLSYAHTPYGRETLKNWLTGIPEPAMVDRRQAAVARLADEPQLRFDLELHGRLLMASQTGPSGLIAWAESPLWYRARPVRRWLIRGLTLAMILLPCLVLMRWLPIEATLGVLALVAVNVLVNALFVGTVHDLFNQITAGKRELEHYTALFEAVDRLPTTDAYLAEIRGKLSRDADFRRTLRGLQRIMALANGRRSSVFGVPYVIVQILFFWDFHVLESLERWQRRHGLSIRHWLEAVGELEALASLAAVAADHRDWTFPQLVNESPLLTARALGHPLLDASAGIRNDVRLGPPGTFLLVTGSNMSGKSTLLRAIGVNVVLAQAGGPVAAAHMLLPCVELATSMRVTDSLTDGVSFFFAELQRLKWIVDRARQVAGKRRLLFLLDEILQGTNSAERHIAVARVIGHLIERPTLGAVSTHDLELAEVPELAAHCQTVHFREQFTNDSGQRRMSFDYQLRSGVSPTTNALKLLELVGLDRE